MVSFFTDALSTLSKNVKTRHTIVEDQFATPPASPQKNEDTVFTTPFPEPN